MADLNVSLKRARKGIHFSNTTVAQNLLASFIVYEDDDGDDDNNTFNNNNNNSEDTKEWLLETWCQFWFQHLIHLNQLETVGKTRHVWKIWCEIAATIGPPFETDWNSVGIGRSQVLEMVCVVALVFVILLSSNPWFLFPKKKSCINANQHHEFYIHPLEKEKISWKHIIFMRSWSLTISELIGFSVSLSVQTL